MRIATAKGKTIIPSVIGVQEKAGGETEFLFGYDAQEMNRQNYRDEDAAVFYDIKRWISDADRVESVILKVDINTSFREKRCSIAYLDHLLENGASAV